MNDGGHRPHGTHFGETPEVRIDEAPWCIKVTLDTWGPQDRLFPTMYDMLQANWGDAPSRSYDAQWEQLKNRDDVCGWSLLTPEQQGYIEKCFAGQTLPQVLEMITFSFCIDGVTRAFTHQNVRTRIGAAFMQHGGRDNDWRHRPWTMPETIARAAGPNFPNGVAPWDGKTGAERTAIKKEFMNELLSSGKNLCITDWKPIDEYLDKHTPDETKRHTLTDAIYEYLKHGKELYAALVDAGIPYQDARRVLPIGTQTYIHDIYSFPALKGVLANRLEHVMDWEHNCVAQLMLRELNIHCPSVMTKHLGSRSDLAGKAAFDGLDSWPPDGKYPVQMKCECGHAKQNHKLGFHQACEVCERQDMHADPAAVGRKVCTEYTPMKPDTFHRAEQNPFWVLTPAAMAGGPIDWIWTNGTYPHDRV
jgi:thymidylate synthase ThyX